MDIYKSEIEIKNKKVKDEEARILCNQMGILLQSGCEITKIMDLLKSQSNNNMKNIIDKISININKGNSITDSFDKVNVFSPFFINMMKAGELSGNLDKVMGTLANYYEKDNKIKSKIKSVSAYPILLIVLSLFAMIFAMVAIVPSFEMILIGNDMNLPLTTKILLNMSSFIRTKYIYIIVFITLITLIAIYLIQTSSKVNQFKQSIILKIPIIKNVYILIMTTRFSRSLRVLIQSGIQIVDAIDISSKTINNSLIYSKILISLEYIIKGNSISYSLDKSNIFPSIFISMINVGEESGRLEESLRTIETFYNNELENKIEKIMKNLEPATILVIGPLIGIFIISMVSPMFDAIVAI